MDELDLSGVDPLRRAEVRRRVAVIKSYLAIPFPTEDDRRAHDGQLDRSVNQFMALVRVWREHRSAAKVAASGAHRGGARRPSRLALDSTAKDEAARIISEMGPDAPLVDIVRAVTERSAELGVKPPSRSTLWNMAVALRQDGGGAEPGIVVGTCAVRLPMASGDGVALPSLTIAVRGGDGAILLAALDDADWEAATLGIAAASDVRPLRVDKALLRQKRAVSLRAGIEPVAGEKARSALSRILGLGIDDVRLVYRPSKAVAPERLLTTREDRPLTPSDLRAVVTAAIARHNATRGADDARWIDAVSASKDA